MSNIVTVLDNNNIDNTIYPYPSQVISRRQINCYISNIDKQFYCISGNSKNFYGQFKTESIRIIKVEKTSFN